MSDDKCKTCGSQEAEVERLRADAERLAAALSGFRTAHREEPVDAECLSGIGRCSLCIAADTALAAHEKEVKG